MAVVYEFNFPILQLRQLNDAEEQDEDNCSYPIAHTDTQKDSIEL